MMKITGLSHLFKWENLHNWWLTKYFFAPLCVYNIYIYIYIYIYAHTHTHTHTHWPLYQVHLASTGLDALLHSELP